MNLDFDIYAYLRLSPTDVIIVCISTFLLVIFAKRFFWDKVLAFLDARKAAIQADIDSGAKQRMEGEAYKEQYEKRLADASKEAHELIETAKANADYITKPVYEDGVAYAWKHCPLFQKHHL